MDKLQISLLHVCQNSKNRLTPKLYSEDKVAVFETVCRNQYSIRISGCAAHF